MERKRRKGPNISIKDSTSLFTVSVSVFAIIVCHLWSQSIGLLDLLDWLLTSVSHIKILSIDSLGPINSTTNVGHPDYRFFMHEELVWSSSSSWSLCKENKGFTCHIWEKTKQWQGRDKMTGPHQIIQWILLSVVIFLLLWWLSVAGLSLNMNPNLFTTFTRWIK